MIGFFSPKDPSESIVLSFNFVNLLSDGETIVSAQWLVEKENGEAVTASDFLTGDADYSADPIVRQMVKGGVHGSAYLHRAVATTSTGRILAAGGIQSVVKGA